MTLKDFVIEAVSRGRNTKRYVEISTYMDVWEWIDNLRKTGLEEEHTTDLFVEPVPGKIYVSRFSNTGEWVLKFIAGSMRLKVFFYPDGKFECIYSKKTKSTNWNFRKDVGPCIAEINYWLPEMVKEAISRGRSGYKEMELNLSPEVTLDKFIEILEMNGYHVIEKLSDYMSVPDKTKEAWLQRRVTGFGSSAKVKLVAGGKPFKLHFNNHDRFMSVMVMVKKYGRYDWQIIRYDEGTEQLSKLLTEAIYRRRSGYKSMELSPDITEAISSGTKRTRYIDGESLKVDGTTCKEFLELLRDIEGTELVPLDPGKDYGYSKDTFEVQRDISYLFKYAKDRFKPGQVIWHRFGRSDETVLVYLSDGSSNLVGEVFILDYRGGDKIGSLQKAEAKKSKGMGGVDTWYIEDSKKSFLTNMERLEEILANVA